LKKRTQQTLNQFIPYFKKYKFEQLTVPFEITEENVDYYEQQLQSNIVIYQYYQNSKKNPSLIFSNRYHFPVDETINLLLICDDNKEHFVFIKNLSRLIQSKRSTDNNVDIRKKEICGNCLTRFSTIDQLKKHVEYCKKNESCEIEMSKYNTLCFTNYSKTLKSPFAYYPDFETINKKDTKLLNEKKQRS